MKIKRFMEIVTLIVFTAGISSCTTTKIFSESELTDSSAGRMSNAESAREEEMASYLEDMYLVMMEKEKETDVQSTIVYVRQPVYIPAEEADTTGPLTGIEAVQSSTNSAIQEPSRYDYGTMYYDYDSDFVYEIYCQPYRVTDLALQPGEQVIEYPYMSETQVWEVGAGVSREGGLDVQHFFLKPSQSGLTTSMIIITDRRVYHLLLKSYRDAYMTIVKFNYPENNMPYNIGKNSLSLSQSNSQGASSSGSYVDPRDLCFEYNMKYSVWNKPAWLPKLVYDDGRRTYIKLSEGVLTRGSPVLFNNSNELINYRVDGNLIIIDEIIQKVTLKYGNQKVTIEKLNYAEKADPVTVTAEQQAESITSSVTGMVISDREARDRRLE